jgi:ABC-type nitrate/sulfonate/bicarbonate transport system permease component
MNAPAKQKTEQTATGFLAAMLIGLLIGGALGLSATFADGVSS